MSTVDVPTTDRQLAALIFVGRECFDPEALNRAYLGVDGWPDLAPASLQDAVNELLPLFDVIELWLTKNYLAGRLAEVSPVSSEPSRDDLSAEEPVAETTV